MKSIFRKYCTFQDLKLKFCYICEIYCTWDTVIFLVLINWQEMWSPWRDSEREVYSSDDRRIHFTYIRELQQTYLLQKRNKESLWKRLLLKPGLRPWIRTLDPEPEKPEPWKTWTLKNLDPEKSGLWKTRTMKNTGNSWMQKKIIRPHGIIY